MPLTVLATISILSAGACYIVARSRQGRYNYWAAMGVLLGPFAIPFVFFAKPVSVSD